MIDLVNDNGFVHFARIKSIVPDFPDFVKQASLPTEEEVSVLPASSFANTIDRKFPMHTKAATWLSYLYFIPQKNEMSKHAAARIERRLKDFGEFWGIASELSAVDSGFNHVKRSSVEDTFALSTEDGDFYATTTSKDVIKSAHELLEDRGMLTYEMRKQAAENLMRSALSHGLQTDDLPEEIHKMAGFGLGTKQAAIDEINRRIAFAKGSGSTRAMATELNKVAEDVDKSDYSRDLIVKVARFLDGIDRELGVHKQYGAAFQFPEDALIAFTEKTAAMYKSSTVKLVTGKVYDINDIIKKAEALNVFGDGFVKEVRRADGSLNLEKIADILPTMPRDEAELFDNFMTEVK